MSSLLSRTTRALRPSGVRSFRGGRPTAQAVIPLDEEYPGLPPQPSATSLEAPETKITTLANGFRVASEETYGQSSSIGLFVDTGSRYETSANNGVSHLLEHMAFKSTESRSHLKFVRDIEDMGGNVGAACAREHFAYTADVLRENIADAVEMIADTVMNATLNEWEVEEQKKVMAFELEDQAMNPQAVLTESLHAAAFGENTPLGRPLLCPEHNLGNMSGAVAKDFMAATFSAPRMVLAGAGVDHEALVSMADSLFSGVAESTTQSESTQSEKAVYTGGEIRVRGEAEHTHVALAFDAGAGWHDKDLVPLCALHLLLGGGGSFSAGGPGKGMYSQLYLNVLTEGWVDSATAYNTLFTDSGMFGIYGTSLPQYAGKLVDVMSREMEALAAAPADAEAVLRAKNQLKSSVLYNLESRQVLCEDIGRQVLTYGSRESPAELCRQVEAVTAEDIQRVARRALESSKLTFAAFGDTSALPTYDRIASRFS